LKHEFINIKKEIENGTIRDQKTINRRIKNSFRGQGSYVSDSIDAEDRSTNVDNVGLYTETQFRESLGRRSDTSSTKDFGTGQVNKNSTFLKTPSLSLTSGVSLTLLTML
jgi:hypothetical protein